MTLKELVKGKKVRFKFYRDGELWYETDDGFEFPVPISDTGTGIFKSRGWSDPVYEMDSQTSCRTRRVGKRAAGAGPQSSAWCVCVISCFRPGRPPSPPDMVPTCRLRRRTSLLETCH